MSHVLVVEDEPNVRKLVTVNLTSRGYTVTEASNAQQALAHLRAQAFDLMVLDIKLPDFTGWDILTKVAADATLEFNGPVLVMTASVTDAHIDLEQYPLVVDMLIKPFNVARLVTAVDHALHPTLSHRA